MQHKSFEILETKADGESGTFEALVSVFNNVDSVGDRILPGAFTKTLKDWQGSGDPIPVILSHQWENPMAHIGVANPSEVKQTPRGLVVKGQLDIADNDVAKQVYKLMKRRSLKAFSFGYHVPDGGEAFAEDGINDVTEINLVEVGPTLVGANPEAQLQSVKSALEETKEDEPPRDEEILRKETEKLERERQSAQLPPEEPEVKEQPIDQVELASQLRSLADAFESGVVQPEEELAAEVQRNQKSVEVEDAETEDRETGKAQAQDPLYQRSMDTVLEVTSAGESLRKPPKVKSEPKPEPRSEAELKRYWRDQTMEILMQGVNSDEE